MPGHLYIGIMSNEYINLDFILDFLRSFLSNLILCPSEPKG